jgi:hypothetical protein
VAGPSLSDDLLESVGCLLNVPGGRCGALAAAAHETRSLQCDAEDDWARSASLGETGSWWWRVEAVEMRAAVMERWLSEREEEQYNEQRKCKERTPAVAQRHLAGSVWQDQPGEISSAERAAKTSTSKTVVEGATDEAASLDAFFAKKDRKHKKKGKSKSNKTSDSG